MTKKKNLVNTLISFGIIIVAYIVCKVLINGGNMSRMMKGQLVPICVYIVMSISLNLVVGHSGELSLGHAGFMSIGAFTGCVISGWLLGRFQMENTVIRLIISMIFGGAMAGIFGFLIGIPVLKLRGDYLAIVTLAFGEIIRSLINILYVKLNDGKLLIAFNNPDLPGKELLSGAKGTVSVARISTFDMGFVLILFTLFVVLNLINSRTGRAIRACRDSRIAAENMGINPTRYKMIAFVTSAVLAGMAGALYGLNLGNITADKFDYNTSILILVYVVLGGIGNIWGGMISATVLVILPQILQKVPVFQKIYMLIYAILLIAVMLLTNMSAVKNLIKKHAPKEGKGA